MRVARPAAHGLTAIACLLLLGCGRQTGAGNSTTTPPPVSLPSPTATTPGGPPPNPSSHRPRRPAERVIKDMTGRAVHWKAGSYGHLDVILAAAGALIGVSGDPVRCLAWMAKPSRRR